MSEQDQPPGPGYWKASDGNWYPPQPPADLPPPPPANLPPPPGAAPPPPGYQAPPPGWQPPPAGPQKMNGCLKAFLIVLGIGFVGLIVLGIVAGLAVHKAAHNITSSTRAAQKTCAGQPSYPNQLELDHCADGAGQVMDFGLTVTLRNVHRVTDAALHQDEICATVTYKDRSNDTKTFSESDWSLQTPADKAETYEITSATLGSGSLSPGQVKTGSVCFTDDGEHGRFIFVWQPEVIRSDRGIWFAQL